MNKAAQILGLLAAALVLFFLFNMALMLWQLTPICAVSKYDNVMRLRWHRKDLVEHFPKTIPADAQNTKFHYHAGFLQGGAAIELRLKMPSDYVEDTYSTFMSRAKSIFHGDEQLFRGVNDPDILPKWHFYTFSREQNEARGLSPLLPEDFDIVLLASHPYKSDPTDWNHGESSGISISRKRNEIIYWAEDW